MRPGFRLYRQSDKVQPEELTDVVKNLEEEARMILPGIQALFGFQLIAVFNQRFTQLTATEQRLHLGALFCSALSVLLALAPAALHRQALPMGVSRFLAQFSTVTLTIALLPLAAGTTADLYVIVRFVTGSVATAATVSGIIGISSLLLWFIFPQSYRRTVRKKMHA